MTKDDFLQYQIERLERLIEHNGDQVIAYRGTEAIMLSTQLASLINKEGFSYDNLCLLQDDLIKRDKKPLWND